jgi:hypothetical protein
VEHSRRIHVQLTLDIRISCGSTPSNPNWKDPWSILLGNGTIEYLTYQPAGPNNGSFYWTQDFEAGALSAYNHFVRTFVCMGLPANWQLHL